MKANMKRIDVANHCYYNVLENGSLWSGVTTDDTGVTFEYYNQDCVYRKYRIEYYDKRLANELPSWFLVRYMDPKCGYERIATGLDFLADGLICVASHNAYFKSIQAAMTFIEETYPNFRIHVEDPQCDGLFDDDED
jgi:hypothetical protein